MKNKKLTILDSTLRDGAQGEGISFSVRDKIAVCRTLDELGVDYIEAGNPASNPKDAEFFREVKNLEFKNAKLTAFGSTRRRGVTAQQDPGVKALLAADTPAVSVFGKSWDFHATEILRVTLEENLEMIYDTVNYLTECGKEVIFDAEHFFDGYKNNPDYAIKAIKAAEKAGAAAVCLCDTNGGCFPDEIEKIVRAAVDALSIPVGIHTHDDAGMAVANSVVAVLCGAILGVLLWCFARFAAPVWVFPLFKLSPGASSVATMMITMMALIMPLRDFNSVNIVGVLRGGGDVKAATLIDIGPLWGCAIPYAVVCGVVLRTPVFWVYLAFTVEQVVKFFLGVWRLRSEKWVRDLTRPNL